MSFGWLDMVIFCVKIGKFLWEVGWVESTYLVFEGLVLSEFEFFSWGKLEDVGLNFEEMWVRDVISLFSFRGWWLK